MKLPEKNITQWYAHEIADAVNKSLIDPSEIAISDGSIRLLLTASAISCAYHCVIFFSGNFMFV